MHSLALKGSDLGTHSARKGAATYCCNGTTDAPSIAAIHLRGGWKLEGVTHRYIRFDCAMDQKVGRTVAGLPVMSGKFAVLPPFFTGNCDSIVRDMVDRCFPNAPDILQHTLRMCLASVVYHAEFLGRTLPANHPLRATTAFQHDVLSVLKPFVVCRNYQDDDPIKPTGLSPCSAIIADLECVKDFLFSWRSELVAGLNGVVEKTVEGVTKVLEDRAVGMNTVTKDGLQQSLQAALAPFAEKLDSILQHQETSSVQPAAESSAIIAQHDCQLYLWGGTFHRVPEDFDFPRVTVWLAFQLWWLGDPGKKYPPLNVLQPSDMGSEAVREQRNKRRRLADLRSLMQTFDQVIAAKKLKPEGELDIAKVNTMFKKAAPDVLRIPDRTPKGRLRRSDQAVWSTIVREGWTTGKRRERLEEEDESTEER